MLKNPFGIRNDEIIVVSSLTEEERGLKCNCVCPECNGKFEAKMGDIKIHHFAHTKDPCDETLAFIKGLFMFIKKMINNEKKLYVPALIISYRIPPSSISVTINNIKEYVKIGRRLGYYEYKINGSDFNVNNIELKKNSKNRIEALVVTGNDKKQLAIRISPPPNACKPEKALPYENLSTLVCDARDIDFYKNKEEVIFEKLKDRNRWSWKENKKVEKFYGEIIEEIRKKQQEYLEPYQKTVNIMNKPNYTHKTGISSIINEKTENRNEPKIYDKTKEIYPAKNKEEFRKCSFCGETKPISEMIYYQSNISDGKERCRDCRNVYERIEKTAKASS